MGFSCKHVPQVSKIELQYQQANWRRTGALEVHWLSGASGSPSAAVKNLEQYDGSVDAS